MQSAHLNIDEGVVVKGCSQHRLALADCTELLRSVHAIHKALDLRIVLPNVEAKHLHIDSRLELAHEHTHHSAT